MVVNAVHATKNHGDYILNLLQFPRIFDVFAKFMWHKVKSLYSMHCRLFDKKKKTTHQKK